MRTSANREEPIEWMVVTEKEPDRKFEEEKLYVDPLTADELDPLLNEPALPEVIVDGDAPLSDDADDGTTRSVGRNAAMMSVATLTSRATGFVRTWAIGIALGNTLLTSSYTIANNIPNMIYELVAGGLLSTAFLPVYMEQVAKYGKKRGWNYASTLINIVLIALGIVALLATIFAPQVIQTQMFRNPASDRTLAIWFFRFFAIQIMLYGAGAIIAGLLNANRRFIWPAMGPIFNNIIVIITLFAYIPLSKSNPHFALTWLAVGTTLGVVAMFSIQIPALMKIGMKYVPKIDLHDPGLKKTLTLAIPAIAFTISNLVAVSVRNAYAYEIAANGPATLSFAWMWYQLPYGVIAVALSTAIFTELSDAAGRSLWKTFKAQFVSGLRTTLFLIIPLAMMLILLSRPLVMMFRAGKFTLADVGTVSHVLSWWGLALPFFAAYMFVYFAFSSIKDLKTVAIVNAILTVGQVVLYATLTAGVSALGFGGVGLIGVPITDLIFYSMMFFVLLFLLRRRIGSFDFSSVATSTIKVVGAAIVGGAGVWALSRFVFANGGTSISSSIVTLLVCGLSGLAVTWGICALLKVPETAFLGKIAGRFTSRVKR